MSNVKLLVPQENVIYRFYFNLKRVDEFIYTGEVIKSGTGNPRYKFLNVRYGTFTSMTPERFTYGIRFKLAKSGITEIEPKKNPLNGINSEELKKPSNVEQERKSERQSEYEKERRIIEWLRNICPVTSSLIEERIGRSPNDIADDIEKTAYGKCCSREEACKADIAIKDYITVRQLLNY